MPTKIHIVKAVVFPGAIHGCDSWTIKKPEHWRTATWKLGWRILLRVPWTAKRLNQSILKENQPWIWIRRTGAEAEGLILWLTDVKSQLSGKEPNVGQDWRQKEKGAAEDEMVRQHHWINGYQFVSVHSLSRIWLSVTPWTAARQASLSPTPRAYSNSCPSSSDAIQPSHPMLSLSPPAFNLFQHQGLFKLVSSLHQVARVLEFQLQN